MQLDEFTDDATICPHCKEHPKTEFIQPCKHILCSSCIDVQLAEVSKNCPICNGPINGVINGKLEEYGGKYVFVPQLSEKY